MFNKLDFNVFTDSSYLRNQNHVTFSLEQRLASMYGASRVFLTSSCMEAITSLMEYLMPRGGNIVVDKDFYFEMHQYFDFVERYNLTIVDCNNFKEVVEVLDKADVLYLDNPSFFAKFYNIRQLSELAHKHDCKLVVDNTLLSVYYMNPINDGADYAVESYTKYLSGHGDVSAGGIICKDMPDEKFEWFLGRRGRLVSALTVYLIERSLETFSLRMERHTENGRFIYGNLLKYNVSVRYSGFGGCLILPGVKENICDKFKVFRKAPTFGVTHSTVSYAKSPFSLSFKDFIRLSCGIEDKKILWEDVQQALSL